MKKSIYEFDVKKESYEDLLQFCKTSRDLEDGKMWTVLKTFEFDEHSQKRSLVEKELIDAFGYIPRELLFRNIKGSRLFVQVPWLKRQRAFEGKDNVFPVGYLLKACVDEAYGKTKDCLRSRPSNHIDPDESLLQI
jgi:hypothetical protein